MKKLYYCLLIFFACSYLSVAASVDTLWKQPYGGAWWNLVFSETSPCFLDERADIVFGENNGKYEYKKIESDLFRYTVLNEYAAYFDKTTYKLSLFSCYSGEASEVDMSFLKDYSYYLINYYDLEVALVVNRIYNRAKILDVKTHNVLADLTEFDEDNNTSCELLYKVPGKSEVLGVLARNWFVYDYQNKEILNRFELPELDTIVGIKFANDSLIYYKNKYNLIIYNIKSNKYKIFELDSNKRYTFAGIYGSNTSLLGTENTNYFFYDYLKNERYQLDANIGLDFKKIIINGNDTVCIYSRSNEGFSTLSIENYHKQVFDTLQHKYYQDTIFNGFSDLRMSSNGKLLFTNKSNTKIIDIKTGHSICKFPDFGDYQTSIKDIGDTFLIRRKVYVAGDIYAYAYLFDPYTSSLDSLPDFEALDIIGKAKYGLKDSADMRHIYNKETGNIIYSDSLKIEASSEGRGFGYTYRSTIDNVNKIYEVRYRFIIIRPNETVKVFDYRDTVPDDAKYSGVYIFTPDTNYIIFTDKDSFHKLNIHTLEIESTFPRNGYYLTDKISEDSRYFLTSCSYALGIWDLQTKELVLSFERAINTDFYVYSIDYWVAKDGSFSYCVKFNYSTSSVEDIFDIANQEKMQVYPNPASQDINIDAESYINKIEIYSVSGELISAYDKISSSTARLQLENLSPGAYIIKAYFDGFTYSKKFVKE